MNKMNKIQSVIAMTVLAVSAVQSRAELLAHWRFEEVLKQDRSRSASVVGESLTGRDNQAVNPRPFSFDDSGLGNHLQVWEPRDGSNPSKSVFSDDVSAPIVEGRTNLRSLALKGREYSASLDRLLPFADLRKNWTLDASVMTRRLDEDQVFVCKERTTGAQRADLAMGYDPATKKFYLEVKGGDGELHRVLAGEAPEAGKWYAVHAAASYDAQTGQTKLTLEVKLPGGSSFGPAGSTAFRGYALPKGAARWIVGRGFPTGKYVADGGIDEVRISGEALPRVPGQNPIFTNTFTADPAAMVVGDTVYAYVGRDAARVDEFFNMPEWLCYSSKDLKTWTAHGTVMRPEQFAFARAGTAWAAQMVPHEGKYYFYTTLRQKTSNEHCIGVAVGDSPTGPFKDARGTPLITDGMTTNSSRPNADIDPTVFIGDDGTPWMAWGNGDFYFVKLKRNMIELDGPIQKVPHTHVAEGPWLFKRGNLYYNVYAADVPGTQPEQIAYATAPSMTGPWTFRGLVTGPARVGFTIHPSVIEFKGQWYFFYHDGSTALNGLPGGDCRRSVCLDYLFFNPDGTIQSITLTQEGISITPQHK